MFKQYDAQKILNTIKLISKAVRIARDENNTENRKFACSLVEDLLNVLYREIDEITEGAVLPKEYNGSSNLSE